MDEVARHKQALERFKDLLALAELLMEDVTDAAKNIDTNNPSRQRNYVRTVFAMIEGALNAMCRAILEEKDIAGWGLSADEIEVLSDSILFFRQGTTGRRKQRQFKPLVDRIKVAFAVSRRMLKEDCGMDFTGKDWDSFRKTMAIRNRLSHPKQSSDLEMTNEDIELTHVARDWFRFGVKRFFIASNNYLRHIYGL